MGKAVDHHRRALHHMALRGEEVGDRASMLMTLANLNPQPQSVPINMLIPIDGTPLGEAAPVDGIDFVRCIAVARIMMPKSVVRLSAGREWMSDETQALCFLAGANSIFVGEELLTTSNPNLTKDNELFSRLGLEPMAAHKCPVSYTHLTLPTILRV